jgi:CubicO group peptidase (beta-lactamase class C family)
MRDAYSNSNYILLGAIIEGVSGLSFAEFVKASIFGPVDMRSTSCGGPLSDIRGLAEAY